MDQTKQPQPKAKFVAFKQRYATADNKRPQFTGRIGVPGTDREFRTALWAGKDKNGKVIFTGQTAETAIADNALEQINSMAGVSVDAKMLEDNNLKLRPGQIVLFTNGFRDDANPKRPHFFGRWNNGEKIVDISVWARESRAGDAMLTGQTQYRMPGKKLEDAGLENMSDAELTQVEMDSQADKPTSRRRGGR